MAQVRWTPQAADDLEAIAERISQDSAHYASLLVMDVLAAAEKLIDFPRSGRTVPERGDPCLREIVVGNYRLIYRVTGDLVEVLTIYHGARLLDPSKLL